MKSRALAASSIRRYEQLLKETEMFAEAHNVPLVSQWNLDVLRAFRHAWKDTGMGVVKKLERLRTVMKFAAESGWTDSNDARKLKAPKVKPQPTLPFSAEEMTSILSGCNQYGKNYGGKSRQLRALVLLMRYSGLRIGDALSLARDRIKDGKLFLYTQKTGTPVWCPLPEVLLDALADFKTESERYYFWSGRGDVGALTRLWMKKLNVVFDRAGIEDGHSHRFRDTFAVELLKAGVPIERVSVLLGHSSIRITERHYNPWVKARQEQLEADVRATWAADSLSAKGNRSKVISIGQGTR
jgi:integrase